VGSAVGAPVRNPTFLYYKLQRGPRLSCVALFHLLLPRGCSSSPTLEDPALSLVLPSLEPERRTSTPARPSLSLFMISRRRFSDHSMDVSYFSFRASAAGFHGVGLFWTRLAGWPGFVTLPILFSANDLPPREVSARTSLACCGTG